ncbi:GNAT family N-acetyltransferase [Fodinicola acaciae]|uniref:GNAT family N-acetyltransferase n=1 Tax=Fodinicola acaciae TaxID=2681555 RepID=UPI0013D53216|nr:GNAT family N-acetyltransferase [Fodinicola acaciae]
MTVDIRVLTDDAELRRSASVFATALVGAPELDPDRDLSKRFEPGRTLGAFVDGEMVGTANAYTSWLVSPGGDRLPHAAVTHVGVLPTHTRRGVLSGLMRRQLADFAARGEVVASLRASEGVIYGRFGYGVATIGATYELTRERLALRPEVPAGGRVRLLHPDTGWQEARKIYPSAASWVGAINRPAYWWDGVQYSARKGQKQYFLVHGEPGAEDGFLRYEVAENWWESPRTIVVHDLIAASETAYAGLVRYLVSIDLVERIKFDYTPTDTPLAYFFVDPRALNTTSRDDETWLRLVDVPAALSRRTYRGDGSVTVSVTDNVLPDNNGTYVISGKGASRTESDPDLSVDVSTLAALYLGGPRWWQLARAGRVTVHRADAVAEADDLFHQDAAPFCGTYF